MAPVKWALIGCGDIAAKRVAAALRDAPWSRLVAVSRRQAEKAEAFARQFEVGRWHAGWKDAVTDADVDAVYVATPVHLHAEMAVAAAAAGKHVLCEKPMALAVAECDRMIGAAESTRVKLGIAYYRRFYPLVRRVRAMLDDGAIGDVVSVRVDAFEAFDPAPDHPRRWLVEKDKSGGGPMFDFGCHRLELLLHLLGPVSAVQGLTSRSVLGREVEDTATAVLRFEKGALATVTVTHAAAESRDTIDVYGTKGSLHVPRLNGAELLVRQCGVETTEHHPAPANLHQPLVDQFVRTVLEGGEPAVDGTTGREVNRLLAEIYRGT
jgi:predicted dehydrogenase